MPINPVLGSLKRKKSCDFKTSLVYHGVLGQPGLHGHSLLCENLSPKQIKEPNQLKQTNKNPLSINNQTQQILSFCHGNLCLQAQSCSTLRNPKENISVKSDFSCESDLMVLHTFNWKAEAGGLL